MDANVQVALVSVLATLITTFGVVAVAIINNKKERTGTAQAAVEATLDEKDVLGRMLALITENERKESLIQLKGDEINELKKRLAAKESENRALRAQLRQAKEGTRE